MKTFIYYVYLKLFLRKVVRIFLIFNNEIDRTTKDEKTFHERTAFQTFKEENEPFVGSDTTNRIHTITCYKNEINISGWTQFSEIFRKTTICILRHRVGRN